jgi:TolB-like protein/DNA-binding CsgD family transcriptional regulator
MRRTGHAFPVLVLRRGPACRIDRRLKKSRGRFPVTGPNGDATPGESSATGRPDPVTGSDHGRPSDRSPDDRPETVAVLPFVNRSDDGGQTYFSDGIAEDITHALAGLHDVQVTAWGSSVACRPFAGDLAHVAAELAVRHVVDGSFRRVGDRLQITINLHDSRRSDPTWADPIWAERLETWTADAPGLGADLARRIAARIAPDRPWPGTEDTPAKLPDPHAYELVLRARALLLRGSSTDDPGLVSEGVTLAQQAAQRDRQWGEAQRCVAWGHCLRAELGGFTAQAAADYETARQVALRLRDLGEDGVAAHAILGHVAMRQMRHEEALGSLRLAHELQPQAVTTLRWLAWEEANHEHTDESKRLGARSLTLSPCDKLAVQGHWVLALANYVAGNLESCIEHARRAVAMRPRLAVHYIVLAACLAELGELSEAHYTLVAARALAPSLVDSRLAGTCYFVRPGLTERYVRALRLADAGAAPPPGRPRPDAVTRHAVDDATIRALAELTAREREVLGLVASGQSNAQIAAGLGISEHTAKRHVANVLDRLQLPTRGAAATLAARHGLI